jgi:hypothetical protein
VLIFLKIFSLGRLGDPEPKTWILDQTDHQAEFKNYDYNQLSSVGLRYTD